MSHANAQSSGSRKSWRNFLYLALFLFSVCAFTQIASLIWATEIPSIILHVSGIKSVSRWLVCLANIFIYYPHYLMLSLPALLLYGKLQRAYMAALVIFVTAQFLFEMVFLIYFEAQFALGLFDVILGTSATEVSHFCSEFFNFKTVAALVCVICAAAAFACCTIRFFWNHLYYGRLSLSIPPIIIALFALNLGAHISLRQKASLPDSMLSYRLTYAVYKFALMQNELHTVVKHPVLPNKITSDAEEITGIVIIGESATRTHHSIYGYERNTTPRIHELRGELAVFDDVVTTASITSVCIINSYLLYDEKMDWKSSVVDLLSAGGYEVTFISSQNLFTGPNTPFKLLFRKAVRPPVHSTNTDESMPANIRGLDLSSKKNIVFAHLIGSHTPYGKRVPEGFGSFPEADGSTMENLGGYEKAAVNAYDNSIEFTDSVIGAIIDYLKSLGRPAFLIYASDHGETPWDSSSRYRHTELGVPEVWEIPMYIWTSKEYNDKYPEIMESAKANEQIQFQTDNRLLFTVMDLARIGFEGFPYRKSAVSKKYKNPDVRIIFHDLAYDKTKRSFEEYKKDSDSQ